MTATETTATVQTYRALQFQMPSVYDRVEKANRKLAKLGLDVFQVRVVSIETATKTDQFGNRVERTMVNYELVRPDINRIAGWTFVARLDVLADGSFVTAVMPGQELNGYRPATQTCDHCGIDRYRKATYLLRHDDGEIKQVGSTCLAAFLGVEVLGLWALEWEPEIEVGDDDDLGGTTGGGWVRTDTPLDVIRAALAVSQDGRGYVSRATSEIRGGTATASLVFELLYPSKRMQDKPEPWFTLAREALRTEENETLGREVLEFAKNIEGDSDYATNLRALASQERIEARHFGLVASTVASWYRNTHERVERQTVKTVNEWVGKEGDKLAGIKVTVTGIREMENQWGTTTLFTFKDEQGRVFKWFASGIFNDVTEGDKVTIVRATVKKHDEYNGTKQTVLTRVKFEKVEGR
jgi:hypothetical protein